MTNDELEAAKLRLEEKRWDKQQEFEERRITFEESRAERESSFFRSNIGVFITAMISVAAIFVSAIQFFISKHQSDAQSELAIAQDQVKHNDDNRRWSEEHKLKLAEFITQHQNDIFSDKSDIADRMRRIMSIAFTADILAPIFNKIEESSPPSVAKTWAFNVKFNWDPAAVGDCAGRDVGASFDSPSPVLAKCDASFVNRIAVCWDGTNLKNGPKAWCTYKSVTPEQCAGGAAPGRVYRCVSSLEKR
jgi:hypothetical protein